MMVMLLTNYLMVGMVTLGIKTFSCLEELPPNLTDGSEKIVYILVYTAAVILGWPYVLTTLTIE